MDSYIADTYGNRGHSNASHGGGGAYSSLGGTSALEMNGDQGDYDIENHHGRSRQVVPQLGKSIVQPNNSSIANRMAEVRARKGLGGLPARNAARTRRPGQAIRQQFHTNWNDQCTLQMVTLPQIISGPTCSRRFRTTVTWTDQNGRPHRQDINFGEEGKAEFIDHQNPDHRDARIAQLSQSTLLNPLHPNFYRFHFLNKYPSLNVAYYKFIEEHKLGQKRVILKKDFRGYGNHQLTPGTSNNRNNLSAFQMKNRKLMPTNVSETIEQLDAYQFK